MKNAVSYILLGIVTLLFISDLITPINFLGRAQSQSLLLESGDPRLAEGLRSVKVRAYSGFAADPGARLTSYFALSALSALALKRIKHSLALTWAALLVCYLREYAYSRFIALQPKLLGRTLTTARTFLQFDFSLVDPGTDVEAQLALLRRYIDAATVFTLFVCAVSACRSTKVRRSWAVLCVATLLFRLYGITHHSYDYGYES